MDTTPKKSNKTRSVTKVSSVAEFKKWVNQIGVQTILFRGMANTRWHVESSLYRRLKLNGLKHVDDDMFLEMTKVLINRARRSQHGMKNDHKLNDLKLLVDLQHYGAATCMIDFTKKSLVALFFACETAYNKKNKEVDGKVVAFNSDNADSYDEISIENSDEEIEYWIQNNKLWVLSAKKLNNRAASQKSVFVFGSPTLSVQNFRACKITNKKEILDELKEKENISAETLFDDFVGFSASHSHNKKYENWDTDSNFVSGRLYQASGDFETAIQYYDKEIKYNIQDPAVYNNRGVAKGKLSNFQGAFSDFDKAISLNPKDPTAYNNRGLAKRNLRNFQDAIGDFDNAIRLNPKYWAAYNNCGLAKHNLGNFQDAISDFDNAIRLNPKSYEAYNNRGNAKKNLGKSQDAIGDFNEVIKLNPKCYEAYNNRGLAKNDWGKPQDAISDYNKAIRLNPKYHKAYNNRGLAKNDSGKFQDAINDCDEAIRLNPKYYEAYNSRGIAKKNLGKFQDAVSDFDEAIKLNPEDHKVYVNRGNAKNNLRMFQDAVSDYNEAIKLNPEDYKVYANRGNAKIKLGDIKGAVVDFAKVKEINPELEIPDLSLDNSNK